MWHVTCHPPEHTGLVCSVFPHPNLFAKCWVADVPLCASTELERLGAGNLHLRAQPIQSTQPPDRRQCSRDVMRERMLDSPSQCLSNAPRGQEDKVLATFQTLNGGDFCWKSEHVMDCFSSSTFLCFCPQMK